MKLLPATDTTLLRWTLVALCIACTWLAVQGFQLVFAGELRGLVTVGFSLLLGTGLWMRLHVARLLALVILWFVVIFVPLGMINPFAAMDVYGPNPPSVWRLVMQIAPWVVVSLFVIHVLGKYKSEFRWRPGATA
jgi:hypothetical protein